MTENGENEKEQQGESKEEKAGVVPVDDIKGSDADSAYADDENSVEELAAQQLGTEAAPDDLQQDGDEITED